MEEASTLYDLYLGDIATMQGYRCSNHSRQTAPLLASKFSTGEAGETDLDLFKSKSVSDFAGGMFQRTWDDDQKVARAFGFYNKQDDQLYPTPPALAMGGTLPSAPYSFLAKAENELYSFVAYGYQSVGNIHNKLYVATRASVIAGTPTFVEVTSLPNAIKSSTTGVSALITGLCFHKGYLYVSGATTDPSWGTSFHNYRYNIELDTWQDIGSFGVLMFTVRGLLFMLGYNSDILSVTNETIAGNATYTVLDYVGLTNSLNGIASEAVELNGAGWIAKPEGLYRFDGVKAALVVKQKIQYLTVFNNTLYYASGNWLYKFDGTTITKLQYFGTTERITGMSATPDFLLIQTIITELNSYSEQDSPTKLSGANALLRTYTYDGNAIFQIMEKTIAYNSAALTQSTPFYVGGCIFTLARNTSNEVWYMQTAAIFTPAAVTTDSKLEFTLSEHDANFTNILKTLEALEARYNDLATNDVITFKYQLYDGKSWGSWVTAGTITPTTDQKIELTDKTNKLYKRARVFASVALTTNSPMKLKGASIRFTVQPRTRWRWRTLLKAEGNSALEDRQGNPIVTDANAISNTVLKAIRQKTPLFLFSPDYGFVKTSINSSAKVFVVKGQPAIYKDPYNEYPLCSVYNGTAWEVLRVTDVVYDSGADETTITVLERGYYGVTPATIPAGAEFHVAYKVFVTNLINDNPILQPETYNQQPTTAESQMQREFLVEITETN